MTDSRAALRLLESEGFDLVLRDLMIARHDGHGSARGAGHVRAGDGEAGRAFTQQARAFLDAQPHGSVEKPINIASFRTFLDARIKAIDEGSTPQ